MRRPLLLLFASLLTLSGCASHGPPRVPMEKEHARPNGWQEKGEASWYGHPYHGRKTASGETYNMYEMTAAHRSLPFGTRVRVKRRDTGEEVIVRITDRGPFIKGRIIDLSYAAAQKIHLNRDGVAPVKITVVDRRVSKALGDTEKPDKDDRNEEKSITGIRSCFWVQVGAFGDHENAKRALKRLRKTGKKVLMVEGTDGLEKIRSGPFDSHEEAIEALSLIRSDWPAARLVECGE